jgi:hypothetical protein
LNPVDFGYGPRAQIVPTARPTVRENKEEEHFYQREWNKDFFEAL